MRSSSTRRSDAQLATMVLGAVGAVIVLVSTIVGIHDQFSPPGLTWFFSHVDADGDASSPFLKSLAGSGAAGAAAWFMIRRQLRRYMDFGLRTLPRIRRDRSYEIRDLLRGKSRVPLHDVKLRVVACNMELGQYRRGSGTDERTVSFREPIRGVLLYEKAVDYIPPDTAISPYFDGEVHFEPMFAALYPPFAVTGSHGVAVHWEVQLLHPEYVDQELVGPTDVFRYDDFLDA